ncbi:flagellar assembly peptidoglycan hydrolase FlgJ [Legionella jordanis]|uniref:flagellar assembly peptidoglycan hydrolase FlgJ n=1 Tax=Legionella jordanis TaxID=456 RepID=UPI000F003DDC|nr:flagellar assembly peptidoglycan hydrolase FlgJ [Legionella jordanis]RMX21066.1 flagellar assembly peptidoglycan hydrolase FlgJ [Legionella jordanis]
MEGIAIGDFKGLQELKRQSQTDSQKALPEVAKQFEAIFLQSMLKSMRLGGEHLLEDGNPLKSNSQDGFQDMLDGQYASNLAHGQGIGLATMLTKELKSAEAGKNPDKLAVNGIDQSLLTSRAAPRLREDFNSIKRNSSPASETTIDEFVKSLWPYAQQAAGLLGLDPKILLAQAALETGWGQFVSKDNDGSSKNFFNIKATSANENAVKVSTTEFIADTPVKLNASFRRYSSVEHSFNDYVALIRGNSRYETALANSQDPERFVTELHRAGYATDPEYSAKILAIYHGEELQQALARNGLPNI